MPVSCGVKGAQVVKRKKEVWKLCFPKFCWFCCLGFFFFKASSYLDQMSTDTKDYLNFPGIQDISKFFFQYRIWTVCKWSYKNKNSVFSGNTC